MVFRASLAILGCAVMVSSCAGKPDGPVVAAGKPAKCEHVVGSLMCAQPDEVQQGNMNDPSLNQHKIGP